MCKIRDKYTSGKLISRYADATLNDVDMTKQKDRTYIKQLELIEVDQDTISEAVLLYFKAISERTTWIKTMEILPQTLKSFDQELCSRWKNDFDDMCESLEECQDKDRLIKAGRKHFREIQRVNIFITSDWMFSYLTRGSYHVLADELKLGWHPSFRKLLTQNI